jgi:LPXTG-site transpeptidase (sortase) family protein
MSSRKGILSEINEHRGAFAAAFVGIFLLTFLFLSGVGATPDPIHPVVLSEPTLRGTQAALNASSTPEAPVRIVARDIGLDATIANPSSVEVQVLDEALLKGAVRYPTSAMLGMDGTVLLFGHSSYLPIVHNQAFKTFDDIQKLKPGQVVSVFSGVAEYRYSVTDVRVANAEEDSVELNPVGKHLTLVTCDSFSKKTNRFIVTADFVGAYALTSH